MVQKEARTWDVIRQGGELGWGASYDFEPRLEGGMPFHILRYETSINISDQF